MRPVVNFTSILQAALLSISFCQKNVSKNCKYRKAGHNTFVQKAASRWNWHRCADILFLSRILLLILIYRLIDVIYKIILVLGVTQILFLKQSLLKEGWEPCSICKQSTVTMKPAMFFISVIRLRISSSSAVNWISPFFSGFPVEVGVLLLVEVPDDISLKINNIILY